MLTPRHPCPAPRYQTASAKTAAVYACAAQVGFNIIEVNASTNRSRSRVLKRVGEATQSRKLVLAAADAGKNAATAAAAAAATKAAAKAAKPKASSSLLGMMARVMVARESSAKVATHGGSSSTTTRRTKRGRGATGGDGGGDDDDFEPATKQARGKGKGKATQQQGKDATASTSSKKKRGGLIGFMVAKAAAKSSGSSKKPKQQTKPNADKGKGAVKPEIASDLARVAKPVAAPRHRHSLILFEEVDLEFAEDRSFLASVQALMRTAKCPIVLTCNGQYSTEQRSTRRGPARGVWWSLH